MRLTSPLVDQSSTSHRRAEISIETIETMLVLRRETGRYEACGAQTEVLSVDRPSA